MFARFNENPAMTLQDIKETKRYGRTDNVKTVYPLQTKFAGGIKISVFWVTGLINLGRVGTHIFFSEKKINIILCIFKGICLSKCIKSYFFQKT